MNENKQSSVVTKNQDKSSPNETVNLTPQSQPPNNVNVFAILGFLLILLPPVGLILSIIGLRQIKKTGERGRLLAILGIILGILNIVITLFISLIFMLQLFIFSSVTTPTIDTIRQRNINTLQGQIETYYDDEGIYPTYAQLKSPEWRGTNLLSQNNANSINESVDGAANELGTSPENGSYFYSPKNDKGKPCTNKNDNDCTQYTLGAVQADGSLYEKENLK